MQKNFFSYLPTYQTKKYRVGVQKTNNFLRMSSVTYISWSSYFALSLRLFSDFELFPYFLPVVVCCSLI